MTRRFKRIVLSTLCILCGCLVCGCNPGNENINNNDGGYISNDVCGFEIHSIESRCVKFRYNRNSNDGNVDTYFFHVVFQLVEFY